MAEHTEFQAPVQLRDPSLGGGASAVSYGTDEGFRVRFYEDPLFMEAMSKSAGYPIFRKRIMTELIAPGNTKTTWVHETTGIRYDMSIDEHGEIHTDYEVLETCENGDVPEPLRFARAWNRFLRGSEAAIEGMPIEEWGAITKTYAAGLKLQNIHTVQMLAALSDGNAQNIMGGMKYRDLARAYLDERSKIQLVSREQEARSRAEEKAADLARQVKELQGQVAELITAASKAGAQLPSSVDPNRPQQKTIADQLEKRNTQQRDKRRKGPPKSDDAPIETAA